ncbi:MAG: PAS domain-containing sensor histidine kinase, partial [Actinobacteria bacterium]|nr:PAS domain-containing sensor histidine kinase [Actinomycetota bacterium]
FDEKGGRIIISTRLVQLLPKSKNMAGLHDYIELQIQDTGKGIPPGLLNKIIQPYVSSKTGGTGLGLSIVQKVMDSHGGEFHITSQEGVMTTVTLRFQAEIKKDI